MSLANASVGAVIAVSDLEAARHFYAQTLGLAAEETPGGVLLRAGGDTVLYLLSQPDDAGSAVWPVASFHVEDLPAIVAELQERGVSFLSDDDLPFDLDERNIADQGDLAVAWMRDLDGNVLTVFSTRP